MALRLGPKIFTEHELRKSVAGAKSLSGVFRALGVDTNGYTAYYEYLRRTIGELDIDIRHFNARRLKPLDELTSQRKASYKKKNKAYRSTVARAILIDTRHSDAKAGLREQNDLTVEFIESTIVGGCNYCGDVNSRMTLDRISNLRGHSVDNVVPACIRCNVVRRDMPYEAWLLLAPDMKDARQRGLFGDWVGGFSRRKILGSV